MQREEILARLMRISKETLPYLADDELDVNKSYRDLGINSLDLMDILTAAMKEFKVKIPREELSQINTICGLADAFAKATARTRV